jgi:hypothetical protein
VKPLLVALLLTGCATMRPRPVALIVEDSSWPLEYRSDLGGATREVRGEACRNAVGLPLFLYGGADLVGWDEAGFRDAIRDAQSRAPGATLSDVRADVRFLNILVFRRECIEVTAAAR